MLFFCFFLMKYCVWQRSSYIQDQWQHSQQYTLLWLSSSSISVLCLVVLDFCASTMDEWLVYSYISSFLEICRSALETCSLHRLFNFENRTDFLCHFCVWTPVHLRSQSPLSPFSKTSKHWWTYKHCLLWNGCSVPTCHVLTRGVIWSEKWLKGGEFYCFMFH